MASELAEIAARGWLTWSNSLQTNPMRIRLNLEGDEFVYFFDQEHPESGERVAEVIEAAVTLTWVDDRNLQYAGTLQGKFGLEFEIAGEFTRRSGGWFLVDGEEQHSIGGQH